MLYKIITFINKTVEYFLNMHFKILLNFWTVGRLLDIYMLKLKWSSVVGFIMSRHLLGVTMIIVRNYSKLTMQKLFSCRLKHWWRIFRKCIIKQLYVPGWMWQDKTDLWVPKLLVTKGIGPAVSRDRIWTAIKHGPRKRPPKNIGSGNIWISTLRVKQKS